MDMICLFIQLVAGINSVIIQIHLVLTDEVVVMIERKRSKSQNPAKGCWGSLYK